MSTRKALMLLAVGVLLSGLSGVATADEQGKASVDEWQAREAMETGAVPDRPDVSSDAHSSPAGDAPTVEYGGVSFRPEIDGGP